MSCGVGRIRGLDLAWLWLWHRPAAAAPIQPLAWELLYAAPAALKSRFHMVVIYGICLSLSDLLSIT